MATKQNATRKKITAYLRALEAGKAGYAKANELLEELTTQLIVGQAISIGKNETAWLVDKFAGANRIGAGLGVNRYEIRTSRAKELTKRL